MSSYQTGAASPELMEALRRAWPGVTVRRLEFTVDGRGPDAPSPERNGDMCIELAAFGSAEHLQAAGLVTPLQLDSLSPTGLIRTRCLSVTRAKTGYRVEHTIRDDDAVSGVRTDQATRLLDTLTQALIRAIWQPQLAWWPVPTDCVPMCRDGSAYFHFTVRGALL